MLNGEAISERLSSSSDVESSKDRAGVAGLGGLL
jgi:hypothetical protein